MTSLTHLSMTIFLNLAHISLFVNKPPTLARLEQWRVED